MGVLLLLRLGRWRLGILRLRRLGILRLLWRWVVRLRRWLLLGRLGVLLRRRLSVLLLRRRGLSVLWLRWLGVGLLGLRRKLLWRWRLVVLLRRWCGGHRRGQINSFRWPVRAHVCRPGFQALFHDCCNEPCILVLLSGNWIHFSLVELGRCFEQ